MHEFKVGLISKIQRTLEKLGIRIIRTTEYYDYKMRVGSLSNFERWAYNCRYPYLQNWIVSNIKASRAQLQQDLLAQFICGPKGYFVEFGATNGIDLSNTYLLERDFGWSGVLAEPGKNWHQEISKNRLGPIDHRAVAGESGEVRNFVEASEGEYSTFEEFSSFGNHQQIRSKSIKYNVETVSLNDLLSRYNAPNSIQLISIDTEGSEFEILNSFDFNRYQVDLFFVEHNFSENQAKINSLLSANGYTLILSEVSMFDGWYIRKEILRKLA